MMGEGVLVSEVAGQETGKIDMSLIYKVPEYLSSPTHRAQHWRSLCHKNQVAGDRCRPSPDRPLHPPHTHHQRCRRRLRHSRPAALPQARTAATHRLVQSTRRVHELVDAHGARGGGGRGLGRKPRRGGRLRSQNARSRGHDLCAQRGLAAQDIADSRLQWILVTACDTSEQPVLPVLTGRKICSIVAPVRRNN